MSNLYKFLLLLGIGLLLAAISIWLIGGKKQEFSSKETIDAIPSQIFPYLVESDLRKQWVQGLVEQELSDLANHETKTVTVQVVEEIDGKTVSSKGEVIRYLPNQNFTIKTDNNRVHVTTVSKLNSEGNKTVVTYRKIVRFNGLDRLWAVFYGNDYQESVERDLRKLVKVVELAFPDGGVLEPESPTPGVATGDKDEDDGDEGDGVENSDDVESGQKASAQNPEPDSPADDGL